MFRSIQVLRGVAATAVVVHHAYVLANPNSAARVGAAGVDLFFVISGFIMATVATERSPAQFLADRAWRIFPLWFMALAPWLILKSNDWPTILASLTLWPVWGNGLYAPALGVGWSLCFEMLFYAAFAIALAKKAVIPLAIFALALVMSPSTTSALVSYIGSPIILEFLAGVAIARLPTCERVAIPLVLLALVWVAIAPVDYFDAVNGSRVFPRLIGWGIPAALIVYSARSLEHHFGRAFNVPILIGDSSYAIYLFHPIIVGLAPVPGIVLSLAFGTAVHLHIERPMMALVRGFRQKAVLQGSA
jgi:exopolysaccharide production protein ExoZ